MTAKEELLELVDSLTEDEILELIDFINLQHDPDDLTAEELAEVEEGLAAIRRGEYKTHDQLKRELDL
jgi:hypothetical protein